MTKIERLLKELYTAQDELFCCMESAASKEEIDEAKEWFDNSKDAILKLFGDLSARTEKAELRVQQLSGELYETQESLVSAIVRAERAELGASTERKLFFAEVERTDRAEDLLNTYRAACWESDVAGSLMEERAKKAEEILSEVTLVLDHELLSVPAKHAMIRELISEVLGDP
jgi:hypothetical protein